jgi:GxxExxY protein
MTVNQKYLHSEITNTILQAFYTVIKELPNGLNLDVYKNALKVECQALGLKVEMDYAVPVIYRQEKVGNFLIDIVVDKKVVVKIVSEESVADILKLEVKGHLKLTEFEVALILCFGMEGQHKRLVYTNDLKDKNGML